MKTTYDSLKVKYSLSRVISKERNPSFMINNMLNWKLLENRSQGVSRKMWIGDVEGGLSVMDVRNWTVSYTHLMFNII